MQTKIRAYNATIIKKIKELDLTEYKNNTGINITLDILFFK